MKKHILTEDLIWGFLLLVVFALLAIVVTKTATMRTMQADSSWRACMEEADKANLFEDDRIEFLKGCMK